MAADDTADDRTRGYAMIPHWLVEDPDIQMSTKMVYLALVREMKGAGRTAVSNARLGVLAGGVAPAVVGRALADLERRKIVAREMDASGRVRLAIALLIDPRGGRKAPEGSSLESNPAAGGFIPGDEPSSQEMNRVHPERSTPSSLEMNPSYKEGELKKEGESKQAAPAHAREGTAPDPGPIRYPSTPPRPGTPDDRRRVFHECDLRSIAHDTAEAFCDAFADGWGLDHVLGAIRRCRESKPSGPVRPAYARAVMADGPEAQLLVKGRRPAPEPPPTARPPVFEGSAEYRENYAASLEATKAAFAARRERELARRRPAAPTPSPTDPQTPNGDAAR